MPDKKILEYMSAQEKNMVEDIFTLCRINSVRTAPEDGAPFGAGPRAALARAEELAKHYGFDAEIRGDRVLCVEYGVGEPALAILAHLDVVPEGTGWTKCEPYEPVCENGVLYGRGVADDKGPAMAGLYALRCVKELGMKLGKKMQLLLGSCEETGSEDIAWYLEHYKMPPMVFTPDGDFPVVNIEKGRAVMEITAPACAAPAGPYIASLKGGTVVNAVPGTAEALVRFISREQLDDAIAYQSFAGVLFEYEKVDQLTWRIKAKGMAAHASLPWDGENAACALLNLLLTLPMADCAGHAALEALNSAVPYGDCTGETIGAACEDESGPLSVNLGILDYTPETGLKATLDLRVPVCGSGEVIREKLAATLGNAVEVTMTDCSEPHCVPSDSEFVQKLLEIYQDYTGLEGEPMAIGGGTYVHEIEGGVAFGCGMPGRKPKMHEPDENMPVEDLTLSAAMFAEAIRAFCGE